MKKGKLIGKILGIALAAVMIGITFGILGIAFTPNTVEASSNTLYAVSDGYAWSGGTSNPSRGYSAGDYLRVGFSTGSGNYRTLLKFDVSSIPAGATIASADLNLYYYAAAGIDGDPLDISVYRTTVDWTEGSLTWSKAQNYASPPYDTVTIIKGSGAGYKAWDITSLVQNWVDGTYNNYGVLLRAPTQSGSSIYRTFRSKEYGSYAPELEVTYIAPPAIKLDLPRISDTSGTPNTSNPGTTKTQFLPGETVRVTLRADNSGDTADVKVTLNIRNPDNSTLLYDSHDPATTDSGSLEDNSTGSPLTSSEGYDYYSFDKIIPLDADPGWYDIIGAIRNQAWTKLWDTTAPDRADDDWDNAWLPDEFKVVTGPDGITKYYALLIGSGAWYDERRSIQEWIMENDVNRVQDTLLSHGANWHSNRIETLINKDVSQAAIDSQIHYIGLQMDADDVFLLYYSGHGGSTGLSLFSGDTYRPVELRDALDAHIPQGAKSIIMLDACHSGHFVDEFDGFDRANTAIISATKAYENTPTMTWIVLHPWTHSLFTHHFTSGIDGGADNDGNREVSFDEIYNYIYWRVVVGSATPLHPLGGAHPQEYSAPNMGNTAITKEFTPSETIPTISLNGPADDITVPAGEIVHIYWGDSDDDDNATISLARDTDDVEQPWATGGQTWLAGNALTIPEDLDDAGDHYEWNTTGVPSGTYVIWGMIYDGTHIERYSRAPGLVIIEATSPPLSLECMSSPNPTEVGQTINCMAGASGGVPPYSWLWTIDGTLVSTDQNTNYTFSAAGSYTVCVTVTDSSGNWEQCCKNVMVLDSPLSLVLLPATDTNPVGTTHYLTATLYDQFVDPMPGVNLAWSISGVGSFLDTPDSQTDANGAAQATITSSVAGISTVRCEVAGNILVFDTATKIWAPKIWCVDDDLADYPTADFTSIQQAVDAANSGDTVIVYPGTYTENVDVNKDHVTIRSENGAEVTIVQAANPDDHVFEVTADYVNINGFRVEGTDAWWKAGIHLAHVEQCSITDNIARNNDQGILLEDYSRHNTIENNDIELNHKYGLLLWASSNNAIVQNTISDNQNAGIELGSSSNHNNIRDNIFMNDGIVVLDSFQNSLEDNTVNGKPLIYLEGVSGHTIKDLAAGQIILVDCEDVSVENMTISNTYICIQLLYSSDCSLLGNTLSESDKGIYLRYSGNNRITDNRVLTNCDGIQLIGSASNDIRKNALTGNQIGLLLAWSSDNNCITENYLSNETQFFLNQSSNNEIYLNNNIVGWQLVVSLGDSTNLWNSPEEITYTYNGNTYTSYLGNYWNDYTGSDANGDGIGETPYVIDSDADNYPLMELTENYKRSYAIIVSAREEHSGKKLLFDNAADVAYIVLRGAGYSDEQIHYLNTASDGTKAVRDIDEDGTNDVDDLATCSNFKDTLNQVITGIGDDQIIIYLYGHGAEVNDVYYFIFDATNDDYIDDVDFYNALKPISNKMVIIVNSCHSGGFITNGQHSLSEPNRIIITSTPDYLNSFNLDNWSFSNELMLRLFLGDNVKDSFIFAASSSILDIIPKWLDDNGDKNPSNRFELLIPGNDGELAANTYIGPSLGFSIDPWFYVKKLSPGELRVYDLDNNLSGVFDGQIFEEIPRSHYDQETDSVVILPSNSVVYVDYIEVLGTTNNQYGIEACRFDGTTLQKFYAEGIIMLPTSVHRFFIDWDALSQGEQGVTVQIDSDGDGIFERTITSDSDLTGDEFVLQTATVIDFDPNVLNLRSRRRVVTVYIELPEGYDVEQIDVSSIRLNESIPRLIWPTAIGDHNNDGIPDLMVKFDWREVQKLVEVGESIKITVTGEVEGVEFEGIDTIRVINS